MRICKEAGRPFPQISEDDVVDYIVTEAVTLKFLEEQRNAEETAKHDEWKKDESGFDRLRQEAS